VINGVQAMPAGGILAISAQREDGMAVAEVRDQGSGIPKEMHDKVFELYFTTKKEGSGIGLAQTYQILQWHYGSVDFESSETGTVFRFKIPIVGAAAESIAEFAAGSARSQRGA
jgi:signal transduction histidine kinase